MKALVKRLGVIPVVFVLGLLLGSVLTGTAVAAYQGHMWNAIHDLQNAKSELVNATANKGGHRVNAINLINRALQEVQWGIDAAKCGNYCN